MEDPARVVRQPLLYLRVLVGSVIVEDGMDHLACRDGALDGIEERTSSFWLCRGMQRPTTVPSRALSAANRVVVPLR